VHGLSIAPLKLNSTRRQVAKRQIIELNDSRRCRITRKASNSRPAFDHSAKHAATLKNKAVVMAQKVFDQVAHSGEVTIAFNDHRAEFFQWVK